MSRPDIVEQLIAWWDGPLPEGDAVRAELLALYTDPVRFNGEEMSIDRLASYARGFKGAYSERRTEVLSRMDQGNRVAVVVRTRAKHTGTLSTPLGPVAATGRAIDMQVIDLLTLDGGKIRDVWTTADSLGNLLQVDAIALKAP